MLRVRLTYAKRGRASFIPHIAIPALFSRSGRRAGISFELTRGFSPRPRISLGPELPVGVPALNEPFEVWLRAFSRKDLFAWIRSFPPGFTLVGARVLDESAGAEESALSKSCEASSYLLALRGTGRDTSSLERFFLEMREEGEVLSYEEGPFGLIRCIMENPGQRGPGYLVRTLKKRGIIEGWPELFLLREVVGRLAATEKGDSLVLPLAPHWM